MQDSLGGNAKTLMFVNISPADYNQDETVTALTYATRVKLITNTAEKHQVGGERRVSTVQKEEFFERTGVELSRLYFTASNAPEAVPALEWAMCVKLVATSARN